MSAEKTEVLVIGAGQAGVAMSEHLSDQGIPYLVLERGRIAERWRSQRWDSLVANGPAWHDRFPNMTFDCDPDAFAGKESIADYFAAYAKKVGAPIRCGVEVRRLQPNAGRPGFRAETAQGTIEATYVVVATGPFQIPAIPPVVPETAGLTQLHSAAYRNPGQLPAGAVLVVGAGSSGVQIADELLRAGRKVYLSVGPHERPPRRYRGRDFVWWLGVLNKWDADPKPGSEHTTIAVSGANGGRTVDFRELAERGIVLLGRTERFSGGVMTFAPDLAANVAGGDANLLALFDEADAYNDRNGLNLPPEPEARKFGPDPDCMVRPVLSLDLAQAGVSTILWATGFRQDFGWIEADTFDSAGRPIHRRGVSGVPGLYFLGLPYLSGRGSSFIWGVWHDAKSIAGHIAARRNYMAYRASARA